ncbi:U4/U6 small nuclear ribonucleoprotein PRP31, putative [Plasmodium knowlesi strain H]|uniref:U4/U6 small nuclear ribonucleoprotein PRP31, putative n=3 Tax=Plasmodium knowlesi TaxID=5850 RepID=A0A1A7VRD7_PLAKH|nr:U4/U6 small nuclear ribonucleoprotein PRP31, putative [Plasmodium knowlesi strain H]OTN68584.1 putative U4/U6 small nuclear ribonucleoprotein PRP31 [Plasmodium knowlesi]CAA9986499.1 U4/U6 small nuclear ribonucleoprotein PRP31, putative [Plasmodium knowlesi strain H]SBO24242.1 U4/U6 small nuclear ribonucleoprotein PRP31, putative [Plasmodium knowlesi strain H]SBO29746.1 U4/U6 small nuclear ribonucleoprotein PRP31, putative [Plasmodium knowlesi strain H]VVS75973.1 U4/U6 small nuclear ribonucl
MATLADTFLQDLEDLEFEEESNFINFNAEKKEGEQDEGDKISHVGEGKFEEDDYEEIVDAIEEFLNEKIKKKERKISELLYDEEFLKIMNNIRNYVMEEGSGADDEDNEEGGEDGEARRAKKRRKKGQSSGEGKEADDVEDDVDEDAAASKESDEVLIEKCIELIIQIDTEILNIHKYVKDIYSTKFPELDSIVYTPLEYISVVSKIKNESDLKNIDFSDILPNTTVMAITVASSMTTGINLSDHSLKNCLSFCNEALELNENRRMILLYLESKMFLLAPNLTMLLGSALTARLISSVGSLKNLSITSSQNLIVVGSSKKSVLGLSNVRKTFGIGILSTSEIVQSVPDAYKKKAISLLAGKCSLASRVDYFKKYPEGQYGLLLRENLISHLIKLQEPPPMKQKKILPMPDEKRKRKRGGKRYRKLKEKTEITELRKQINRLPFGPNSNEDFYTFTDQNAALLNSNITKLKYQSKQKVNNVAKRKNLSVQSSGVTGGLSSSLIFTPLQGIELFNPSVINPRPDPVENKYFSSKAQFRKV